MSAGRLTRALLGAMGIVVIGGLALGVAGATPILPGHGGNLAAPVVAGCLSGTTLLISPSIALPGEPIHVQTILPSTVAACGGPVAFVFHSLPLGCPAYAAPSFNCVPQVAGAFPVTETVYAGASSVTVSATLVVL